MSDAAKRAWQQQARILRIDQRVALHQRWIQAHAFRHKWAFRFGVFGAFMLGYEVYRLKERHHAWFEKFMKQNNLSFRWVEEDSHEDDRDKK